MRSIDIDFNKKMSMVEFLIFQYKLKVVDVINAPQGENREELDKAQKMVDDAQTAVVDLVKKLEDAKVSAAAAVKAEQEAKAALDELRAQEEAYATKIADLEKKSQEGSIVARNRAANELAQVKSEDPLPLRRAKLTQQVAVKRSEKATLQAKADEAAAEVAADKAQASLDEAQQFLDKVKSQGGVAQGDIWWLQRELTEKAKYLPRKAK
eukprot:TRINITY_DN345_c0_g1_i3.p2 TRINITY_DN345_c0_g1~~TRINITY_DN345_c0_g1_i3.p2  ORF type:complete len:210 (-),score=91.83 TRINITY_DN345_c0_g1_i3:64-693(-)